MGHCLGVILTGLGEVWNLFDEWTKWVTHVEKWMLQDGLVVVMDDATCRP